MGQYGSRVGQDFTADGFDPLTALERWVEQEETPVDLLTTNTDEEGNVLRTQPDCL